MTPIQMLDFIINNPKYIWALASLFTVLIIVFSIIRAHFNKDNKFDLVKLFAYDSEGKLSDSKARLNGAFLVTSWAFIFLTMNDKLTEWYVAVFLAAWVGDRFAARVQATKEKQIEFSKSEEPADK
jgi:CDP-diglyceride synthetase